MMVESHSPATQLMMIAADAVVVIVVIVFWDDVIVSEGQARVVLEEV